MITEYNKYELEYNKTLYNISISDHIYNDDKIVHITNDNHIDNTLLTYNINTKIKKILNNINNSFCFDIKKSKIFLIELIYQISQLNNNTYRIIPYNGFSIKLDINITYNDLLKVIRELNENLFDEKYIDYLCEYIFTKKPALIDLLYYDDNKSIDHIYSSEFKETHKHLINAKNFDLI